MGSRKLSAKRTLEAYLKAWCAGDWDAMVELMQAHYRIHVLRGRRHEKVPPVEWTLEGETKISPFMVDVFAHIRFRPFDEGALYRFRLIKETAEGNPSKSGRWGVNPDSMRRYQ